MSSVHYSPARVDPCQGAAQNELMRYVKDIRKKRRLSQTQLADMVGCDQSMISKIEAGTANPTLDLIEGIAAALKTTPAALFGLPDLQQRMILAISELPADRQVAALTVVEAMADKSG